MIKRFVERDKNRKLSQACALEIFKGPYVTEKTAQMAQDGKAVVVKVALDANKIDIKKAFEEIFERINQDIINATLAKW